MAAPVVRARLGRILPSIRSLSTRQAFEEESPVEVRLSESFRTSNTDPSTHSHKQHGRFYTVPEEISKNVFAVHSFSKRATQLEKIIGERSIMVREPFLEIKDYLERYDYSQPVLRMILYGRRGCGKSFTMSHLIHYAHKKDWIIVASEHVSDWVKRPKEVLPNDNDPNILDSTLDAAVFLQRFRTLNTSLLDKLNLTTTQEYRWGEEESLAKGQPLDEIISHGVDRIRHASQCVRALLNEIKIQSNDGKFKTLVALSGVNSFWQDSYQRRSDKSYVPAGDFHFVQSFKELMKNDWKNGAIVVTVDENALSLKHNKLEHDKVPSCLPRYLLGRDGFEFFEPFIPIQVKPYTDKEIDSAIDLYLAKKFIQDPKARSPEAREELKFLSCNNPGELVQICRWL